ncbi:hypothetical protein [Micromonospora zhanjiangensis]
MQIAEETACRMRNPEPADADGDGPRTASKSTLVHALADRSDAPSSTVTIPPPELRFAPIRAVRQWSASARPANDWTRSPAVTSSVSTTAEVGTSRASENHVSVVRLVLGWVRLDAGFGEE